MDDIKRGFDEPESKNNGGKIFTDRDEVEIQILSDMGQEIELKASFKGEKFIRVPPWSMRIAHKCSQSVAEIIQALYPNDLLFLFQIDYKKRADAAAKIHKILFYDIYDPAMQVICATLGLTKREDIEEFIDSTTPEDILEIFCTIIEQEINDKRLEAIIKKFQRLLMDRFPLQNVSLGLQELVKLAQEKSITQ